VRQPFLDFGHLFLLLFILFSIASVVSLVTESRLDISLFSPLILVKLIWLMFDVESKTEVDAAVGEIGLTGQPQFKVQSRTTGMGGDWSILRKRDRDSLSCSDNYSNQRLIGCFALREVSFLESLTGTSYDTE
jgi:hypothetical protein